MLNEPSPHQAHRRMSQPERNLTGLPARRSNETVLERIQSSQGRVHFVPIRRDSSRQKGRRMEVRRNSLSPLAKSSSDPIAI